jgi:Na+-driven multidrug efflux pump
MTNIVHLYFICLYQIILYYFFKKKKNYYTTFFKEIINLNKFEVILVYKCPVSLVQLAETFHYIYAGGRSSNPDHLIYSL